jgi:hypothetical protein
MRQERTATDHQTDCLLAVLEPEDFAYLEPHLEGVILPKGTILYETDETSGKAEASEGRTEQIPKPGTSL